MNKQIFAVTLAIVLMSGQLNVWAQSSDDEKKYGDMSREEKAEFIRQKIGPGFNPDNIEMSADGKTAVIKSGKGTLTTNSNIKVSMKGGQADASLYTGEINIGGESRIKTKSGEEAHFLSGTVKIVNGEIVSLKDASFIGKLNGNDIAGSSLNFDSSTGILTTDKGGRFGVLLLKGQDASYYEFSSKGSEHVTAKLTIDGPTISGNEIVVTNTKTKQVIAQFSGTATFHNQGLVTINDAAYTEFINGKKYSTYVTKNTGLDTNLQVVNGIPQSKCSSRSEISCIERDPTGKYIVLVAKSNADIKVSNHDGTATNPIIPAIKDNSKILFQSSNGQGTVSLLFSREPMKIVQGDISQHSLKVTVGYFDPAKTNGCYTQVYGSAYQINGACLGQNFNEELRKIVDKYNAQVLSIGIGDFAGVKSLFTRLTQPLPADMKSKLEDGKMKVEDAVYSKGLGLTQEQAVVFIKLCGSDVEGDSCQNKEFKDASAVYNEVKGLKFSSALEATSYSQLRIDGKTQEEALDGYAGKSSELEAKYFQIMREMGYWGVNPVDKNIKTTSCIDFCTLPLENAYRTLGYNIAEMYTPREIGGKKWSGKAMGTVLGQNLQENYGWEAIYANPDTKNPDDMRYYLNSRGEKKRYGDEHVFSAAQAARDQPYYGINVDQLLVNYAPNDLQKAQDTPKKSETRFPILLGTSEQITEARSDALALGRGEVKLEEAMAKYGLSKYQFGSAFSENLNGKVVEALSGMKTKTAQDDAVYNKLLANPDFNSGVGIARGGEHVFAVVKEISPLTNKPELFIYENHWNENPNSAELFEKTPLKKWKGYGSFVIMVPPGTIKKQPTMVAQAP
ncbi:hypothetical protein J4212_02800 [Candidatus Woesearchaeota archaeon]|nr:hypothetical protein [Candidatus Woesearchaeota archaeon]